MVGLRQNSVVVGLVLGGHFIAPHHLFIQLSGMSHYIHGSSPEEQARLAQLNELINGRCLHLLGLRPGNSVLDIGSGLGQFTLVMADRVGASGKCVGIERDKNQIKIALQNLEVRGINHVEFRQGNVENLVLSGAEWGSFDVAHTRFVLEHVKQPENVVAGMVKAVRKGGRVVLADDDHGIFKLHPEPPGFSIVWQAYIRSYDRLGNDPYIGRRLVSLLHQGGLQQIKNEAVFFGDSAGSATFSAYAHNLIGILEGAKELMIKETLIDESTFQECIQHIEHWSQKPDAALWYTINWAEGVRET